MRKILYSFLLCPITAFAMFCPGSYNIIHQGDSIDKVESLCGKPDKQESAEGEAKVPQEWSYYIPQTVNLGGSSSNAQGTLKTSVVFDADGKAINISVNGIGVGSSTICGAPIALGSTIDQIKAACGTPAFINKQNGSDSQALGNSQKAPKIVKFYYSNPPTVLTFQDGILQ